MLTHINAISSQPSNGKGVAKLSEDNDPKSMTLLISRPAFQADLPTGGPAFGGAR